MDSNLLSDIVTKSVHDHMQNGIAFTNLDISKPIIEQNKEVRHAEIRELINQLDCDGQMSKVNYISTFIQVYPKKCKIVTARLWHPIGYDSDEYTNRSQSIDRNTTQNIIQSVQTCTKAHPLPCICDECGQGEMQDTTICKYETELDDKAITIYNASVYRCNFCGNMTVEDNEIKRWRTLTQNIANTQSQNIASITINNDWICPVCNGRTGVDVRNGEQFCKDCNVSLKLNGEN